MIRSTRASLGATLLLPTVLAIAACGGSSATASPTSPDATPPPAGVAATPTPAPNAPEATPPTVDAIPSFDLSALTGAIPGLDSYRTSFSIGGVEQYRSVVVTQPVLSKEISIVEDGAVSSRFIVIGKETWTSDGPDGKFEAVPEAFANSMLLAFDPTLMIGGFANVDWATAAADQGVEDKNGTRARHLRIDSTTLVGAAAAMPPGSAIDIWIAEAGYIVAWEMTGFGGESDMSIQVTDVNDPANNVERPS